MIGSRGAPLCDASDLGRVAKRREGIIAIPAPV